MRNRGRRARRRQARGSTCRLSPAASSGSGGGHTGTCVAVFGVDPSELLKFRIVAAAPASGCRAPRGAPYLPPQPPQLLALLGRQPIALARVHRRLSSRWRPDEPLPVCRGGEGSVSGDAVGPDGAGLPRRVLARSPLLPPAPVLGHRHAKRCRLPRAVLGSLRSGLTQRVYPADHGRTPQRSEGEGVVAEAVRCPHVCPCSGKR